MPPITGAVIGGGASLAGSVIGGLFNQSSTKATNKTQIDLANTAMQRRVADLKAAGLNPMLAQSPGGSGAAVPNLQAPQVDTEAGSKAANSAVSAMATAKQNQFMDKQALNIDSQIAVNQATAAQIAADEAKKRSEARLTDLQTLDLQLRQPFTADFAKLQNENVQANINNTVQNTLESMSRVSLNDANVDNLKYQASKIQADTALTRMQTFVAGLDGTQKQIMNPLLQQYQQFINTSQSLANNMQGYKQSEAQVNQKFYDSFAGRSSPYVDKLILPILKTLLLLK
jgi:hypothetical protein